MSDAGSEDDQEFKDEEGEEAEHTEQADIPSNPFTQNIVPECLSMLSKIGNGLAHAYVRMDCHDRDLTDISYMKNFIHVRYADISGNQIKDISPLNNLSHLLLLKASKNTLEVVDLDPHPYLQILDLSENKLTAVIEGLSHPQLARLNLNSNMITSAEGLNASTLQNLHTLELRGNKLTSISGLDLPNLHYLYMASNLLKNFEGIDSLVSLRRLHARDNQIESFDGFGGKMRKLEYINVRGNEVKNASEMEKLTCLPELKSLSIGDNPCAGEDNYRIEILVYLRNLKRIDKDDVTVTEKEEAEELFQAKESNMGSESERKEEESEY